LPQRNSACKLEKALALAHSLAMGTTTKKGKPPSAAAAARKERLAKALRENLKRRKAQERARGRHESPSR
jgi:hypothetical protein